MTYDPFKPTLPKLPDFRGSKVPSAPHWIANKTKTPAPTTPDTLNALAFDLHIKLIDPMSGTPLKNMPYTAILQDGSVIDCVSDEAGLSGVLGMKENAQNINFTIKKHWLKKGK